MLGLTVTKLLFTIAVAVLLWIAFRKISALIDARGDGGQQRRAPRQASAPGAAVDLSPCPRCGTYVARGGRCAGCDARA